MDRDVILVGLEELATIESGLVAGREAAPAYGKGWMGADELP